MTKVHIIIPIYNQWLLVHALLWKLQKLERDTLSSIYLINDCSPDAEVAGGMKWWTNQYGSKFPIYAINNEENLGFLKTSNLGLQMVAGLDSTLPEDILILLNTDVQVNGKFIYQIKDIIAGNPKSLIGGNLYNHNTGWNSFNGRIFPYLEGWLLATTVSNWAELGYFDERYSPNDMEDIDLSTEAIKKGYEIVPLNNPMLCHLGAQSLGYTEKRQAITMKNKEKFRKKWINDYPTLYKT